MTKATGSYLDFLHKLHLRGAHLLGKAKKRIAEARACFDGPHTVGQERDIRDLLEAVTLIEKRANAVAAASGKRRDEEERKEATNE